MLIDLQLHSTYSDGFLTPTEVVDYIAKQGVKVAALTDHNTVRGLGEFKRACKERSIKPITGLELYVKLNHRKMNVLWFNFDEKEPGLHDLLRDSQIRRRSNVRKMLKKLKEHGFKIDVNKVVDKYNHYVPINRVISDLMSEPKNVARIERELKYKNPREEDVITNYFRNKRIGVLNETYVDIKRVIKLKNKIGGQLILNHPAKHHYIKQDLWEKLKNLGMDGVEILSPHHSIGAIMYIQQLARDFDFIETGGSDYHRFEGGTFPLQNSWQYFKIESNYLRRINEIIG